MNKPIEWTQESPPFDPDAVYEIPAAGTLLPTVDGFSLIGVAEQSFDDGSSEINPSWWLDELVPPA